jgi:hypothetical protein
VSRTEAREGGTRQATVGARWAAARVKRATETEAISAVKETVAKGLPDEESSSAMV